MRRTLPVAVSLLLGIGAALLAACGGSVKGGIPPASAGELKSQIGDVRKAVDDGRCNDLSGQLRQVDDGISALPDTVDADLRRALEDAGDTLRSRAQDECEDDDAETTTTETEPEPETPTDTTEAETTPSETTTTEEPAPPPPPPPVESTPPPVIVPPPAEPPVEPPATPPATPSGGATPEVDP